MIYLVSGRYVLRGILMALCLVRTALRLQRAKLYVTGLEVSEFGSHPTSSANYLSPFHNSPPTTYFLPLIIIVLTKFTQPLFMPFLASYYYCPNEIHATLVYALSCLLLLLS